VTSSDGRGGNAPGRRRGARASRFLALAAAVALPPLGLGPAVASSADASPQSSDLAAATSWRDDFNTLDASNWSVVSRDCFEPRNVAVADGRLRMTVSRSSRSDCPGVTFGRVNTYGLREFPSGTFEARIKFVLAPGSWQTFWLTGANGEDFPANGEVDIAEVIARTPTNTHVALHSAFQSGGTKRCDVGGAPAATLDRVWHVYGVKTSSTRVTFTIDGATIASYTPGGVCTWPFGDPMRVLFSSRAGQYGGDINLASYPVTYVVDWVSWHA
jgi:beta-glucanase (GH16 family)